jgi:hypothetical protein
VRRADKVDRDVRAVPARHALDLLGEVLRLVVHARRRALREPGSDEVELVLARRGRGDGRPARRQSLRRRVGAGGTYVPKRRASWIAAIPTPDAAAWMRTCSPAFSSPSMISAWYAAYMLRRCKRPGSQAARTGEPDFGDARGVDEREGRRLRDELRCGRHDVLGVRALWAGQSVSNVERS